MESEGEVLVSRVSLLKVTKEPFSSIKKNRNIFKRIMDMTQMMIITESHQICIMVENSLRIDK